VFLTYKKIITQAGLTGFSLQGILAAKPASQNSAKYKNLQVLSQKISDENMDYVMESFGVNLGANCLFCHPGKQIGSEQIRDIYTGNNQRPGKNLIVHDTLIQQSKIGGRNI